MTEASDSRDWMQQGTWLPPVCGVDSVNGTVSCARQAPGPQNCLFSVIWIS